MQRSSEVEHTGHEKGPGRFRACSVAFKVEGNSEIQIFPGGRGFCYYSFGVGRAGGERELRVKENLLERKIWLFVCSLFRQRDLKKTLRRVAEVSSKIN